MPELRTIAKPCTGMFAMCTSSDVEHWQGLVESWWEHELPKYRRAIATAQLESRLLQLQREHERIKGYWLAQYGGEGMVKQLIAHLEALNRLARDAVSGASATRPQAPWPAPPVPLNGGPPPWWVFALFGAGALALIWTAKR